MPCGRKMVQPGLEARLAQNCQPNSCATHLHVQAVAPIQELGVCVCCAEQCHDACQIISLRAISGCWSFSKFLQLP